MRAAALLVVSSLLCGSSAWDADAGVRPSFTKSTQATVTATSGSSSVAKVIDNNDNTDWVSSSCLPGFYMGRSDLNVLYSACSSGKCNVSANSNGDIGGATDGSVYTTAHVTPIPDGTSSHAFLSITLKQAQRLSAITVSGVWHGSNTALYAVTLSSDNSVRRTALRTLLSSDNYKDIQITPPNDAVVSLELMSSEGFGVKEIAAIGPKGCVEQVTIDLGVTRRVGTIRTRHWAGTNSATSLSLQTSPDGSTWSTVKQLDPNALHAVTTTVQPMDIRFIRLEYTVRLVKYMKVYCFEIDAWDEHGKWGPNISPKVQTKTLREILGVNGIWGWGHKMFSSSLGAGQGPNLYNAVASHARNYHNLDWDVTDPDLDPGFGNMAAGHGTQAKSWLNWDLEYGAWKNASLSVDTSIQFTNKTYPQYQWNTPEASAYRYGHEFSKHFGSEQGNGLVDAVEVGNEPWDYDASFYATVLKGMAAGLRSVDRQITILPGAFQAEDNHETNTYIGTRILPEVASNIDVINCHTYSFVNTDNGVRKTTFPENKQSTFNNIRPLTRWRDVNTPNKPIWVTEWGWDASGHGEDCTFPECVTEQAQGVYAIRGLMILARSNIERATWFFYANSAGCTTLFCRSGLTTSSTHNFAKKTVFIMFEEILRLIGDKYFLGVVQENDSGYVYLFSSKLGSGTRAVTTGQSLISQATHMVAWLPDAISNRTASHVTVAMPAGMHAVRGWHFTNDRPTVSVLPRAAFTMHGTSLHLSLSPEPAVIELETSSGTSIVG